MKKILLFCLFILCLTNNTYAKNTNIDKYIDDIKQIKKIDKEKVDKGIEIAKIIKKIYDIWISFKEKVVQFVIKIIKNIIGESNKNGAKIIFIYRQV